MKRYTIHTFSALALLLAATACTRDDARTLPDGTQPLTLTAAIEGSAGTRATVDNRWNGNETIALQVTDGDGTDWYDYMVDDKGNMSGDYYWTNPGSVTVLGLYPNIMAESNDWTWSVEEDQSSDADYQSGDLLCSEFKAVNFGQTPNLTFYHQTAKVVVNIKQEGLPESISATTENISLTIGEGGILAMDGSFTIPTAADNDGRWLGTWRTGSTKGSIKPHLATAKPEGCFATYEALVIPQDVTAGTRLLIFTAEKDGTSYGPFYYTLQNNAEWQPGYVYTYDITIFHYGLDVKVSESINWENGGTGNGSITLQDYTYDESTKTYTVYTAEGLSKWAEAANKDLSTNCILMTDIDLSGVNWNPIGNGNYRNRYTGKFDGNGYVIRNLRQDGSYEYGGFIGHIGTDGRVQNLTLSDVNINNTYSGGYPSEMGAVTGYNEGTISNCEISGSVSQTSEYGNLGSLVGNNTGNIEYCRSSATIHGDGNNYVGGLVGQHGSYVTSSFVRGCSFSGNIIGGYSVGGITGWCPYFYTVIACYSTGTLSNEYNKGGIVGFLQHGSETTACYWEGFDGASFGYCNSGEGTGAYQIDGTTHTWQTATQTMNTALGTDAAYHWHTDGPNTPPTLVPNN